MEESSTSGYKEYVAGLLAGVATVATGHPFDTVKVLFLPTHIHLLCNFFQSTCSNDCNYSLGLLYFSWLQELAMIDISIQFLVGVNAVRLQMIQGVLHRVGY